MNYKIVIPSKNAANFKACTQAIRALGETCEILCVWDGESDDLIPTTDSPFLSTDDLTVSIVNGVKPFSFGRNANLGIDAAFDLPEDPEGPATRQRTDVILMNDDALLQPLSAGWEEITKAGRLHANPFYCLAREAELNPEFGIISAAIKGYGNPLQPVSYQSIMDQFNGGLFSLLQRRTMVPFVCVYIRRAVIDLLGPLEERFRGWCNTAPIICPQCGWSWTGRTWTEPGPGELFGMDMDHAPAGDAMTIPCGQCGLEMSMPMEQVYGGEDNDFCERVTQAGLKLGVYHGCVVDHATLPSSFRPQGGGRSIAGTRMRYYQIHGRPMA